MNQAAFNRYIWLIDTVYKAEKEGITYEDIVQKWTESNFSNGRPYPVRTFHNHRKEIKSVFNIDIKCRKSNNSYYIADTGAANTNMQKLLELVSVNQLLDGRPELAVHLQTELRPGGECYLAKLMNAISQKRLLKLEYKPYWSEKLLKYPFFAPYAIKEFKGSWYLLGERGANIVELIDLKKVTSISTLNDTFVMPANEVILQLLNDHYGSVVENIDTEEIMIKVGAQIAAFLRNCPLHISQREIERKRGYTVFYYCLKPNSDFRRELLSFGTGVEVVAPQHLRSELSQDAKLMAKKNS